MKRLIVFVAVIIIACSRSEQTSETPTGQPRNQTQTSGTVPPARIETARGPDYYARFDAKGDLRALHPEVVLSPDFTTWAKEHPLTLWHETPLVDGTRTVIAQSADNRLFAALTQLKDNKAILLRTADINLSEARPQRWEAERLLKEANPNAPVLVTRPVVTFTPKGWVLTWEFEIRDSEIKRFEVSPDLKLHNLSTRPLSGFVPPPTSKRRAPAKAVNEWLDDDELHHLAAFHAEALTWTSSAASVREKAANLSAKVRQTYSYDSTIPRIAQFTWSDLHVRDTLNRRGICDEFAVVLISYLRSIGIPARQEFLIWKDADGQPGAHSCVEYLDGSQWQHLDPLFDSDTPNPAVYRANGYTDITVMDAGQPRDSRSTIASWGEPDPTGDGELNPYCQSSDFLPTPPYPGNKRAGYSY